MSSTSGLLEEIDSILNRGGDADDVLRDVVAALHAKAGYEWAGIFFAERDELVLGPQAGAPGDTASRRVVPVVWRGSRIAELAVDGAPEEDRTFLERVAGLVAEHCLVGWDTGGESWEP
jgi:putative methionine-R-sulfoxide reductase with GAF domain